jgi:hypothetical protein
VGQSRTLIKDQTLLASDLEIKDEKIFNEKFMNCCPSFNRRVRNETSSKPKGQSYWAGEISISVLSIWVQDAQFLSGTVFDSNCSCV